MNLLLRLFLTISSVSFFVVVYLVQKEHNPLKDLLGEYSWITYVGYVLIPFGLTALSLIMCKFLAVDSLNKIKSVETSNNDFLANYLAFFFVALSVNGIASFWVVFGLTILFTFVSRVSYFNPIFLIFGYNFFYVFTDENIKVMLMTKTRIRNPKNFEAMSVRRINDYTFIEI